MKLNHFLPLESRKTKMLTTKQDPLNVDGAGLGQKYWF